MSLKIPISITGENLRVWSSIYWDDYWTLKAREWTGERDLYLGWDGRTGCWRAAEERPVRVSDAVVVAKVPFADLRFSNGEPMRIGSSDVATFLRARRKATAEELAVKEYEDERQRQRAEAAMANDFVDSLKEDRKYFAQLADETGVDTSREHGTRKHFYSGCLAGQGA